MPQPVTEWIGTSTRPQPEGEPRVVKVPPRVEAVVYTSNWAPGGAVSNAEHDDNACVQLPVEISEWNGIECFCVQDVCDSLTHYLKFLIHQKLDLYKITATGYIAVQIDKRQRSPRGGEIDGMPLAPNYCLPNRTTSC